MTIYQEFVNGLSVFFNLDSNEAEERGSQTSLEKFDSQFSDKLSSGKLKNLYNSSFFAFRNPFYYKDREVEAHRRFLVPILERPGSVLDHGGGAGVLLRVLQNHGINDLTYTDLPSPTFDFVRWFFGDTVKYEDDCEHLKGSYDYIVSNGVLEHIPNPIKTVKMLSKHLNKGGKLLVLMAQDIGGQHLKKAIDKYDEVMSLVEAINAK